MSISEQVSESIERISESNLNSKVALAVAITATFMAIFNIKDGNIVQAMTQAQAHSIDTWSYYQAKSTKEHLAENFKNGLEIQLSMISDNNEKTKNILKDKIKESQGRIDKYEQEKTVIKTQAEELQKEYDRLNIRDDQFDIAEALLSVAVAIFGVTALTRKPPLLVFGILQALVGILFGIAGFLSWNLHPDWLARFLS